MRTYHSFLSLLLASTLLGGCSATLEKLNNIDKPAPVSKLEDPTTKSGYKPLSWPMPENTPPPKQYANSLWQPGARAFFRDGRAARVGDILKVTVRINDKLQFINQTEGKRTTADLAGAANSLGVAEGLLSAVPALKGSPSSLVGLTGNMDVKGTGTVNRQDVVTTQVAAIVTQMLPNGNMVIDGKQEMLMNQDVREVAISGVVRPQDINSDNSIDSGQVADARITYTGRGQLNDVQKPRWGGQVIDAISPF